MTDTKPPTEAEEERLRLAGYYLPHKHRLVLALLDERDGYRLELQGIKLLAVEAEKAHAAEHATLRAELDDMRRSWAVLDEPSTLQRMPHTAESAAMMIRQRFDEAQRERDALRLEMEEARKERDALRDEVQEMVDALVHYRNLAIVRGAKPDEMRGPHDRKLCEDGIDPDDTSNGYHMSTNELLDDLRRDWRAFEAAREQLAAARADAERLARALERLKYSVRVHSSQVPALNEADAALAAHAKETKP